MKKIISLAVILSIMLIINTALASDDPNGNHLTNNNGITFLTD